MISTIFVFLFYLQIILANVAYTCTEDLNIFQRRLDKIENSNKQLEDTNKQLLAMVTQLVQNATPSTTPNKPEEEIKEKDPDTKDDDKNNTEEVERDDLSSILDNTSLPSSPKI